MQKDSFERAKDLYNEIQKLDSAIKTLEDRKHDNIKITTTINGDKSPLIVTSGYDFQIVLQEMKMRLEAKFEKL